LVPEAAYQEIEGGNVVSGYAGGHTEHPTYEGESSGPTGQRRKWFKHL